MFVGRASRQDWVSWAIQASVERWSNHVVNDCDHGACKKQKQTTADYWTGHLPRRVTCFDWLDLYIDLLRNHTQKGIHRGGRAKQRRAEEANTFVLA